MKTGLIYIFLLSACFASASVSEHNKNLIQKVIQEQKMQGYGIEICSDDILPHIEFVGPHITKTTFRVVGTSVPLTIGLPLLIGSTPPRIYVNQHGFDALSESQKEAEIIGALTRIKKSRTKILGGAAALACCWVVYEASKMDCVYHTK